MAKIVLLNQKAAPRLVVNEHIVPRFYLNKFADSKKQVILYTRGRPPRRKSTKSQCSEPHFFEYTVNREATENCYENWFQRIETNAAALYASIHSGLALTHAQERTWALFLATTFLRTRKVREQIGPALMKQVEAETFFGDEQIREMQHDYLKQGVLVYADDLKAKVEQIKQEMRAPAFGQLAGIEESARALADDIFGKRWFVLEATPASTFVTSDCPVQTLNVNFAGRNVSLGSGFRDPNTAIVLPLSPTRLFLAGPQQMRWKSNVLDRHDVLSFNTSIVRFADRAVYASEKSAEVQALVDSELNQVVYGENAFVPAGAPFKPSVGLSGSENSDTLSHAPET